MMGRILLIPSVFCLFIFLSGANGISYIQVNPAGFPELDYMNTSADPCENFYEYTCGNFKNVRPMPEGEDIWDHFIILQKDIHSVVKTILESERHVNEPTSVQKAKAFYSACMDVDYLEKLDLAEARIVKELGGWPLIGTDFDGTFSWEKLGDIIAEYGLTMIFQIQVGSNLITGKGNTVWLFQDKVSNPVLLIDRFEKSEDNYLDPIFSTKRATVPFPFEEFIRAIALILKEELGTVKSNSEIFEDVFEVIQFMRTLSSGGFIPDGTVVKPLSPIPTIRELQNWTDQHFKREELGLDWISFLNHVFKLSGQTITEDTIALQTNSNLIYGALNLVRVAGPRLLQNFMMVRLLTYTAPDSKKSMRDAFETYYKKQNFNLYPRWEYCLRKTLGYPDNIDLSMALTYVYQKYHFNVNKLQGAADMVSDLHDAFKDILAQADWIDDETKDKCSLKANNMITLLGYPEYSEDETLLDNFYGNFRICSWDHFGNSQRIRAFRQALKFKEIHVKNNREVWQNSPLEVNAFYNRPNNRIVFPVSILDPIFFTGEISALDYGRIGAIIGHEITHGFDNNGKNYDENGAAGDIWSEATKASYNEKVDCFKDQYAKYYIHEIDKYVNSTQTLDENLADNGGLREAFIAYKKLEQRKSPLKTIEGFTPEQVFFVGFGTMWCMQESNYYLEYMYKSGVHAPGRFRVNGAVSNNVYFAQAFNCPIGSPMNPIEKCILW